MEEILTKQDHVFVKVFSQKPKSSFVMSFSDMSEALGFSLTTLSASGRIAHSHLQYLRDVAISYGYKLSVHKSFNGKGEVIRYSCLFQPLGSD